ncbi:glycosyltransferase family 61 protein [Methylorubrum extorquens]|uniref:glycosyltransferase family 61 protein n=1 Tax=Methylorubrum extorquens TaxID=408 RepID=UPI00167F8CFF|nr:glycosyltransferase family 61 protein [Methylorubrum extorquens]
MHGHYGGLCDNSGNYIEESKTVRLNGMPVVYDSPNRLDNSPESLLAGCSLFAGPLFNHFGHFLLESMSRLWSIRMQEYDNIIYQAPNADGLGINIFQRFMFEQLGIIDKIKIIAEPMRFERIFVPSPSLVIGSYARSEYSSIFEAIRNMHMRGRPRLETKIYLSRTLLDRGRTVGEELLQDAFLKDGYEIIHPERMTPQQQVNLFSSATHIAGIQGSAFHNVVYCQPGTKTVMFVREEYSMIDFINIDKCCNLDAVYIEDVMEKFAEYEPLHAQGPYCLSISKVRRALSRYGLLNVAEGFDTADQKCLNLAFADEWSRMRM